MKRIILIFILVLMIPNYAFAESQEEIMSSTQEKFNISGFLKEAQKYTNESFEEIDLSSMLGQAIQGKIDNNKLYKIILIGKRNFEINIYDLYKYELNEKIIKIKNKTKPNYNLEEISKENTLRGLFAKEILEEIKNKNYNEEIIENALEIGMEILE